MNNPQRSVLLGQILNGIKTVMHRKMLDRYVVRRRWFWQIEKLLEH